MRRALGIALVVSLVGAVDLKANAAASPLRILGEVTTSALPVDSALVVAFGLSSFKAVQTRTNGSGFFELLELPAGVYRVIAVKQGFVPAVTTVVPSGASARVNLKLKRGKPTSVASDQIWEIRRALPADILRELDLAVNPEPEQEEPRLAGQMLSLTGVTQEREESEFAQTQVELRGALPHGWSVDIAGEMHQMDNALTTLASSRESTALAVALRTRSRQSYRVASTRSSWNVDYGSPVADADLQTHTFAWEQTNTAVEVRYLAQHNLFDTAGAGGSEMLEVAATRKLYSSDRSDLGVNMRLLQQQTELTTAATPVYRLADLSANGRVELGSRIDFNYGLRTRVGAGAQEWSPESGIALKLTDTFSVVASGLYKVAAEESFVEEGHRFVAADETGTMSPRYRYTIGVVRGNSDGTGLKALVTVAAIDSIATLLFDDLASPLWEGYYLENGDIHQDVTLTYRGRLGDELYFDVETSAGRTQNDQTDHLRHFVTGRARTLFRPSGTSLEVAYRVVDQPPREVSVLDTSAERLNFRVGQSLHLPLDLKLLVGMDLVRELESLEASEQERQFQQRVVGGLSFSF